MIELVKSYKDVLGQLGEDPEREGLLKTPERVAKAMQFLTQGYYQDARSIINSAKFHEPVSEMIVVKDTAAKFDIPRAVAGSMDDVHVAVYTASQAYSEQITRQILDQLKANLGQMKD